MSPIKSNGWLYCICFLLAAIAATAQEPDSTVQAKDTTSLLKEGLKKLSETLTAETFTDSLTHMGSRNNLIGKDASPEKIKEYSNELLVNEQTPPAFLVHAIDDGGVKKGNSVQYYEALQRNKVPAEIHLYPQGGHGFGMNNKTTADSWMERLKSWFKANQYL